MVKCNSGISPISFGRLQNLSRLFPLLPLALKDLDPFIIILSPQSTCLSKLFVWQ
uniref:Uncharacterized protein n=1 Tax=Rhizophora mucronata TaxID=61149 RepID=A0A2P2QHF4_RHIMU